MLKMSAPKVEPFRKVQLGTGNIGAAVMLLAVMATANAGARLLTNPRFVRWLAGATKAPTSAVPSLVNQLGQIAKTEKDPAVKDETTAYLSSLGNTAGR